MAKSYGVYKVKVMLDHESIEEAEGFCLCGKSHVCSGLVWKRILQDLWYAYYGKLPTVSADVLKPARYFKRDRQGFNKNNSLL